MLHLDIDRTAINVEELRRDHFSIWESEPVLTTVKYVATLDGYGIGELEAITGLEMTVGHTDASAEVIHIVMDREGYTPEEAIKNLFEAMSKAGVEL